MEVQMCIRDRFKRTLEIKADHKLMVIDVADILYIKASVNDCYIHVTDVYKRQMLGSFYFVINA